MSAHTHTIYLSMYVYINSESDFLTYDLMACALVSFSYPDMTG